MSTLASGQQVGRYRIVRFLGAGAMGEVYLAEDPHIERRLAIKTVRLAGGRPADIEDRKRRLLREARAAGRLLHPNVVTLFDTGETEGLLYLAFEFVEGSDLASRLDTGPPLALRDVLRIVKAVAEALDYAHRQGIVHRDIKPSNILIDTQGHVKVADFGIAKVAGQNTELTVAGSVMGSPQYLSPEQIRGDDLDGRSDIFSLGVVLYEMLSGRRPFDGETITTLVYQILHKDPSIAELRSVPLHVDQLLHQMLAKERDQRIPTAGAVAAELAAIEAELPEAVLSAPAAPPAELDATRIMPSRALSADGLAPLGASGAPGAVGVSGAVAVSGAVGTAGMAGSSATGSAAGATGGPAVPPPTAAGGGGVPAAPLGAGGGAGTPVRAFPGAAAAGSGPAGTGGAGAQPMPVVSPAAASAVPPPGPPMPGAAPAARRGPGAKIWLLVAVLFLLFCAAAGVGAYWFWQRYLHHGGEDATVAVAGAGDSGSGSAAAGGSTGAGNGSAGPGTPGTPQTIASGGSAAAPGAAGTNAAAGTVTGDAVAPGPVGSAVTPTGRAHGLPGGSAAPRPGTAGSAVPPPYPGGTAAQGGPYATRPAGSAGAASSPASGYAAGPGGARTTAGSGGTTSGTSSSSGSRTAAALPSPRSTAPPPYVPPAEAAAPLSPPSPPSRQPARDADRTATPSPGAAGAAADARAAVAPPGPAVDKVLHSGLELAFRVNPPDAFVLLDGAVIGKAEEWSGQRGERSFMLPEAGTHLVKIKKAGMKDVRISVEATATRGTTPVIVNMQPLPAAQIDMPDLQTIQVRDSIALRVQPEANAMILVDGATVGPARRYAGRFGHPDEWLSLPPGTHRVTVVSPGYNRRDLAVEVNPGADKARQKVDVSLTRENGG